MLTRPAFLLPLLLTASVSAANLSFEPNRGQTAEAVRYLAHSGGGVLYFTDDGAILAGRDSSARFELAGANPAAAWEPLDPTGSTTSYRIGRDRRRWVENVPTYRRLIRRQVYPGIDLVYYGQGNRLEYDFRVAPHADTSRIRLRFPGARGLSVAADGSLAVEMPQGTVRHERPRLYETRADGSKREVRGEYRIDGAEAAFRVGKHDPALELSIDPVLDSSTFLGGNGEDSVIFTDGSTTVGNTTSIDFPGAAFGRRGASNVFVQIAGKTLVYGATGNVVATSAAAVSSDNAFVVVGGYTDARDLPTTIDSNNYGYNSNSEVQAWQSDFAGGLTDGFLLILYETSEQPSSFFTYIGTPRDDRVTAVSTNGNYFLAAGATTGRGLPAPGAPTFLGVPSDHAEGTDGFLITGYSGLPIDELLWTTIYFGGSGNDIPLAAMTTVNGDYIAGETTSADFPVANGLASNLKGLSEAFLIRFSSSDAIQSPPIAILYGGSGTERGTALASLSDGTVLLAGVTSSTDLALKNPAQATYGGGASDGFLAMFPPDLSALKYATYIGGSGADEVSSIAADYDSGNIFVGGWTSSLDFPQQNPVQPTFGGGPEDGFVVRYDASGNLQDSTYLGGSGRDHVLGLYAAGGSSVLAYGQTSSADLPLMNPTQSTLAGPTDGFIARMSSNSITAYPVIAGKDLRVNTSFSIGNAAAAPSAVVIVTSSDPSTVQLAVNEGDPGKTSIQVTTEVPYGEIGVYGGYYYVDCLQASGGANLTFSAPGYPNTVVPVTCLPIGVTFSVDYPNYYYYYSTQPSSFTVQPGQNPYLIFSVVINGPGTATSGYLAGLRPGASPIQVQIANSNPAVGTLSQSSATITPLTSSNSSGYGQVTFTPVTTGQTSLSFTSSGAPFLGANPVEMIVTSLNSLNTSYTVPSGFQTQIYLYYTPFDKTQPLTVTSQNPAGVLLSTSSGQVGSASVKLSGSNITLWVQAVAPGGDVGLTFSPPGESPVTSTVHITPPLAFFPVSTVLAQPLLLGVGQTIGLAAGIGGAGPNAFCCYIPNPGNNLTFALTSSNEQAVSVPTTPATIGYGTANFNVTGVAPGNAIVTLQPPAGIPLAAGFASIPVKVSNKRPTISSVEVGNNLQTLMTLTLPFTTTAGTAVQVVSSDPTLVLLSTNNTSAGQAQISLSTSAYSSSVSFYVYGMAPSGQVEVTATVSGMGSATGVVYLDPAGFAWSAATYSATLYGSLSLPYISSYALDRTTMLPVAQENLRPGVTASPTIVNGNPNVIALSNTTNTYTTVAAGTALLTIVQPAGFSQPSVQQSLAVTVKTPTLSINASSLGKNLQASIGFNSLPNIDLLLTVTSSDPSRLLVSSSPTAVGAASVTVDLAGRNNVTIQALADNGTVTLTASMPTFNPGTVTVTLIPTGIGLTVSYSNGGYPPSGTIFQNGQYYSTTQSPATTISPAMYLLYPNQNPEATNVALRPGLGPVQVNVTSSNTAVGTIANSPVTLSSTQYGQQPTVTFTPVGAGETNITVSQPAGFAAVPGLSTVTINVTAPTFSTSNYLVPKDTFAQTGVSLTSNVTPPSANVTVTLTSGDPSRLLLSPDATTAPTASIAQPLIAGHNSISFYMHALANNGTVPIAIGAPGYSPASMSILLTDLTFTFNTYVQTPIQAILQNGSQNLTVTPGPVPTGSYPAGYSNYGSVIRPGASIAVSVTSSDPTTVGVKTPQLVFTGGMSQATATYTPLQPGSATLALGVPAGYATPPSSTGEIAINVVAAPLSLQSYTSLLGRDLEVGVSVNVQSTVKPSTVTVSSSDSSRLLVSADGISAGQASVALTPSSSGTATVYLQSLSDNGTVNVTVSAPGYQTGTTPITLAPSAAVFSGINSSNSQNSILSNAPLQQPQVVLAPLDPTNLQPNGSELPRPGANLSVTVTSSNPSALAVDTPTVNLAVPDPSNPPVFTASLQPLAVGTAIVSLGQYPTAGTPAYGAELVYNLTEPSLILPGFSLGQDLESSTEITLSSSTPTPASALTIFVNADSPIALSSSATGTALGIVTVTIPAGQRVSQPFYVQGTQPGTGTINYSNGSNYYTTSGTVTPTAFVFQEASQPQPIALTSGSAGKFTVIPTLATPLAGALSPLSIRTGANSISIAVTSSNPAVLNVMTPRVFLNPGDQQVTVSVSAVSAGQATLTLSGLIYYFSLAQSSLAVTVQ